jgi:uncharacterized SAM-binding protein YcdF (DUF218 family)
MFTATKIISAILVPTNFLLLLSIAGAALLFTRWRRAGRGIVVLAVLLLIVGGLTPLPEWGLRILEERFPAPSVLPAQVDGIVVLGGDLSAELAGARPGYGLGGRGGGARVIEFAVLARRYPGAKLVYSGGTGSLISDAREADAAAELYRDFGLRVDEMIFERDSRTTWENAKFAAAAAKPDPSETWLLVTSAYHMPRSVGTFRRAGWPVTAYPVGFMTPPAGTGRPGFQVGRNLDLSDRLAHEILGLVMYRVRGFTDTLWPGP